MSATSETTHLVVLMVVAMVTTASCDRTPQASPAQAPVAAGETEAPPGTTSPYDALPAAVRDALGRPFTGDFDAMRERRLIRVGVTFNRTHYFIDRGHERGLTFESLKLFERDLNTQLKTGNLKIHVAIVPMSRDQLYPALSSGKVDMVAAMVTVRADPGKPVIFSEPTRTHVRQVVVTGPGAPAIATVDDSSGHEVFVRKTSVYYESLTRLNAQLRDRGKPVVIIDEAPDVLEDDDILEMVNAGLAPTTVVDDYLAGFWTKVFTNLTVHTDAALTSDGNLAVVFRKDNPKLRQVVNAWLRTHPEGDAFRNTIERRYLQSVKYVKNAAADAERRKLEAVVALFKTYGTKYDLDYLLMAAQGYQESALDQNARSRVGAIGIMQIMPPTGKQLNVGDIKKVDANIHAGVKYVRFMMDQYFKDEPMDDLNKSLMTFAAYNAGPGRLRQLRQETAQRGLNPNVWFGNVEQIASERIGRETVTYVSNIYKYDVAYRLISAQAARRAAAKAEVRDPQRSRNVVSGQGTP